jgi:hypothetical protein
MLHVRSADIRLFNMRTRLPFRYGIVTLRACPHLFLKLTLDIDGQTVSGIAADHLPPKWFTKNPAPPNEEDIRALLARVRPAAPPPRTPGPPATPYEDDIRDMLAGVRHAADAALTAGPHATLASLAHAVYAAQSAWGRTQTFPPLLYNHGVSLVERAAIEALCRAKQTTFARAVRQNLLGLEFTGDLANTHPADWLPKEPLKTLTARPPVGLHDPLTDDDIPPTDRLDDGLPQSLQAAIRYYGLTHFKLKIAGDVDQDLARLTRIFTVITQTVRAPDWGFTLDGNENYHQTAPFRKLWESLASNDTLREPLRHLIFIEQPLHRDVALSPAVKSEFAAWPNRPPIIIDESDDRLGALVEALDCGYAGTSHKNCKGVLKGITSACLIEHHRRRSPRQTFLMSGEDLSNVGPVALPQDLAVCATLGIQSVERNSQHYFRGLSMHSQALQDTVLTHHPDLYRPHETGHFATLRITDGQVALGSVVAAPFGVAFQLDLAPFTPLDRWSFDAG